MSSRVQARFSVNTRPPQKIPSRWRNSTQADTLRWWWRYQVYIWKILWWSWNGIFQEWCRTSVAKWRSRKDESSTQDNRQKALDSKWRAEWVLGICHEVRRHSKKYNCMNPSSVYSFQNWYRIWCGHGFSSMPFSRVMTRRSRAQVFIDAHAPDRLLSCTTTCFSVASASNKFLISCTGLIWKSTLRRLIFLFDVSVHHMSKTQRGKQRRNHDRIRTGGFIPQHWVCRDAHFWSSTRSP